MRRWMLPIAFAACSGGGAPARHPDPQPAVPPAIAAPAKPGDGFAAACAKLKTRCEATNVAECTEMLTTAYGKRAVCDESKRFGEYASCATGCLPSVKCEDDAALNCAAGCGQIECEQGGVAE